MSTTRMTNDMTTTLDEWVERLTDAFPVALIFDTTHVALTHGAQYGGSGRNVRVTVDYSDEVIYVHGHDGWAVEYVVEFSLSTPVDVVVAAVNAAGEAAQR